MPSFWTFLFTVDEDLAATRRKQGCACGGRLHCANYPRQPRGGCENLPESYGYRLSFCCERDGCRKRTTPPSVRFLGRKVYLAAVVVLVAAMRHGPSPRRVREKPPVTIDALMDMWSKDSPYDETEPGKELIRIPTLHSKYLNILHHHKLILAKVDGDYRKMKAIKWEYYKGDLNNPEDL